MLVELLQEAMRCCCMVSNNECLGRKLLHKKATAQKNCTGVFLIAKQKSMAKAVSLVLFSIVLCRFCVYVVPSLYSTPQTARSARQPLLCPAALFFLLSLSRIV